MFGVMAVAMAAELSTEGGEVRVDGQPVRASVMEGERLWVITAAGDLQAWSEGTLVSSIPAPEAVGLFLAGGRVWMETQEVRAVPVEPSHAPLPALSATAPPPATESARVLRVDRGVAIVDRGLEDGLTAGQHIRFLGKVEVLVPSMEGNRQETREVERVVAVGRVRVLDAHGAFVDLARGGRVSVGDRAEVKAGAYKYPVAPERLRGFREVGVAVRPLLALDTVGVAMVDEAWLTVGFETPWYAQVRLAPFGVGWSKDGNPVTIGALGSGGYDSRYFSVGLGAGWSMLNSDPGMYGYSEDKGGVIIDDLDFEDVDSAFAFVQEARLGARDGVHVGVRNTLLLVPTYTYTEVYDETTGEYRGTRRRLDSREFVFGGIALDFAVPTGDRTDLFVDWGTGEAGATWFEGGLSTWLRGNGDRGSVGVRVGAGYASLNGNPDDEFVELYGPMVSVGARYRF